MPTQTTNRYGESVKIRPAAYQRVATIARTYDVSIARAIDMLVSGWELLSESQRTSSLKPLPESTPKSRRRSASAA
jgi:hypothetical protein